ncbi:MFS transporter [Lysobacter soli]|uniref:MFS transporter n=1 Tax=Lysobacter soli TaxID=453783 RepID=UPI00209F1C95|nr:MFS transporter [Lysobacter soli]UTA53324.1 MFS transporter [Lysobacter soli]
MTPSPTHREPALGGPRAWLVWTIAVAFVVYYFSFQTGYSIVNANVQRDVGLSIAQVGLIAAVYTWMFAICQFLSGPLLDRLGARRVLLPAIALVTAGIVVFSLARSFEVLLLSQLIIALGACTGFVGAGYVGGTWFGWARFSFMFGLVQFAASLFSAFNQNLLGHALSTLHWRTLFGAVGGAGVVLLLIAALWLRDPAPVSAASKGPFLQGVLRSLAAVARHRHVWVASAFGALCFGAMLALGVVWAPKLLAVRGLDAGSANLGASLLWLGLAAGCFVAPWISDRMHRRKPPVLVGIALQIVALSSLLYLPPHGAALDFLLCFAFGFGNSAHMLAFSTAADVVEPEHIGTSAAIVNGLMFIVGGLMISRPGLRAGLALEAGLDPSSLQMAQFAGRPLLLGICVAFVIAMLMRETHPTAAPGTARAQGIAAR